MIEMMKQKKFVQMEKLFNEQDDDFKRDPKVAIPYIISLVKRGAPEKALEAIEEVKKKQGYVSKEIFSQEVLAIGKLAGVEAALNHLQKLGEKGIFLTQQTYQYLLRDFPKSYKQIEDNMKLRNVELDVPLLNEFLGIHAEEGDVQAITQKVAKMLSLSLQPTFATFEKILRGLTLKGEWKVVSGVYPLLFKYKLQVPSEFVLDQAVFWLPTNPEMCVQILEQSVTNGVVLTEVQFDKILKLLKGKRDVETMERVFKLALGAEAKLRVGTFSYLADVYAEEGDMEKVTRLLERMKKIFKDQSEVYRTVISSLGKADKMERMWEIWEECSKVVEPTPSLYEAVIVSGTHVDIAKISKLVDFMRSKKVAPTAATFARIIQLFANLTSPEETKVVFDNLSSDGTPLDIPTINSMIACYARDLDKPERVEELVALMKQKNLKPSTGTYEEIITFFRNRKDTGRLLELFWERDAERDDAQQFIVPIAETLANAGMVDKVLELFKSGKPRFTWVYNKVISLLMHKGSTDTAKELLKMMKHSKVDPDVYTFQQSSEVLKESPKELKELFDSVKGKDLKVYQKAMRTFVAQGDIGTAQMLFQQLKSDGLTPDLATYRTLVETYRMYEDVDEVAREMDTIQSMNLKRFNRVARDLAMNVGIDTLDVLFDKSGIEQNVGTRETDYTSRGFVVVSILDDAEKNGVKPDAAFYSIVIEILGRLDCFELVDSTFKKMTEVGIQPTPFIISLILNSYRKQNKAERMLKFMETAREKFGWVPGVVDYNLVLDALSRRSQPTQAFEVFKTMKAQGLTPDNVTYTTLLKVACHGRPEMSALDIYKEAVGHGIPMDTGPLTLLLARARSDRDVNSAIEIFGLLKSQGVKPDPVNYSLMLEIVGLFGGDIPHMENLLKEALAANVPPSVSMYFSMAAAYSKAGNTKATSKVFETILQLQTIAPDMSTFASVLSAMADLGREDQMEIAFNRLKERNIRTFNTALGVYGRKRLHAGMLKLYRRMISEMQPNYRTVNLIAGFAPKEIAANIRALGFDSKPLFDPLSAEDLQKFDRIISTWNP